MPRSQFSRWFFGEDRPGTEDSAPQPEEDAADQSPYATSQQAKAPRPTPPGWYQVDGTLRYHDGEQWTGHVAPPYPASLSTGGIAGAVMIGVLAALFLVWLGSQISPEHIYFPVKFVVEELPKGF